VSYVHIVEGEKAEHEADEEMVPRWFNAVLPFVTVILTAFIGMYVAGYETIEALPEDERWAFNAI